MRLGARRQPPRHQFAARPAGVRHARPANIIVDAELRGAGARTTLPRDAGDLSRSRGSRASTARRRANRCREVAQAIAPDDAGALRRVPLPGAPGRGRAQDDGASRRASSALRSRTRAASSTPRASRRSSSTTSSRPRTRPWSPPRRARKSAARRRAATIPDRDDANWLKHTLWYNDGNRLDQAGELKPSVEAFEADADGRTCVPARRRDADPSLYPAPDVEAR